MVAIKGRKSANKNPPIMSHEFVIQNHADIVSCVAMIFVVGLMMQVTAPWAYTFIAIQHNDSSWVSTPTGMTIQHNKYTIGWKDACAVFFYFLITIIMHAVIQEYIFDKVSKRLHLSKSKLSKFNESCQLVLFYALSVIWGIDIIIRENFILNISSLWVGYPAPMSFSLKFFFIGQIAYWLHCYPELYFQKVKKEEIPDKFYHISIGFVYTLAAYAFNFQNVGVVLVVLNHIGEGMMHGARLIHFVAQKEKASKAAFLVANSTFLFARIATILLSVFVFLYGFPQVKSDLNVLEGYFNTPVVRYAALVAIVTIQIYVYTIVKCRNKRAREDQVVVVSNVKVSKQKPKKKEVSKKSGGSEDEVDSDQGTKKSVRSRPSTKAK